MSGGWLEWSGDYKFSWETANLNTFLIPDRHVQVYGRLYRLVSWQYRGGQDKSKGWRLFFIVVWPLVTVCSLFRVPEWETLTPMKYRGSRPVMRGSTLVWSAMVSHDLCRLTGANTVSPAISFCKMWKCFQFLERLRLPRISKLILDA